MSEFRFKNDRIYWLAITRYCRLQPFESNSDMIIFTSWLWFGKVLSIAETELDASLALYWAQFWSLIHHFVCATRRWHCWFLELGSEPNLLISYAQFGNVRHGRISRRIIGHVARTILRSCWQKPKPERDSNAAWQVLDAIRECHLPPLCCIHIAACQLLSAIRGCQLQLPWRNSGQSMPILYALCMDFMAISSVQLWLRRCLLPKPNSGFP